MEKLLRDRKTFQAWRQSTDVTAAMLLGAARIPRKSSWPMILEGILSALFFVLIYGGAILALIYALGVSV